MEQVLTADAGIKGRELLLVLQYRGSGGNASAAGFVEELLQGQNNDVRCQVKSLKNCTSILIDSLSLCMYTLSQSREDRPSVTSAEKPSITLPEDDVDAAGLPLSTTPPVAAEDEGVVSTSPVGEPTVVAAVGLLSINSTLIGTPTPVPFVVSVLLPKFHLGPINCKTT